jgi:aryl carrier-like protein
VVGALRERGALAQSFPGVSAVARADVLPDTLLLFAPGAPDGAPKTAHAAADGSPETVPVAADGSPETVHAAADGSPGTVHAAVVGALETVQQWLAEPRLADSRLVLVTRGAVDAGQAGPDLAAAAVRGLLRSVQAEEPGRVFLVDLDPSGDVTDVLTALAAGEGEDQIAVRGGVPRVPRLAPVTPAVGVESSGYGSGTVLVTGAGGTLGRLVARHLVAEHGVRRLLLTGRRGVAADGMAELVADLEEQGARVTVAAADVADRAQVVSLLDGVDPEFPLSAVVHAAGVLDDGVTAALTPERVRAVLRPKVDGAWHLHELTRDLDLSAFVLFSSAAATFGGAGQGSYAAANAYLDALASFRRAAGLPAVALAWGLWAESSGMTGHLGDREQDRLVRAGLRPLSSEQGLALLDAASRIDVAELVPAALDLAALRDRAEPVRAPLFKNLVRPVVRRAAARAAVATLPFIARLAGRSGADRKETLVELVREQVAAVLGHAGAAAVPPTRGLLELGLDSLTALELRNRLNAATELRFPATLVFDHPTAEAIAAHLDTVLPREAGEPAVAAPLLSDLERLEASFSTAGRDGLAGFAGDEQVRADVAARLRTLLAQWSGAHQEPAATTGGPADLESATDDEMFDLLGKEFGIS